VIVTIAVLFLLWLVGFAVFMRVPTCRKSADRVDGAGLSIIIPARNEERNLQRLLKSIRSQGIEPLETIVVDDNSEDRTGEVAREFGARVVSPGPLPPQWRGKTWACWKGAEQARGRLYLFLDADTWFVADGLARILGEFVDRNLQVLSVGPYHEPDRTYEQFSAVFNLITFMGMGAFSVFDKVGSPRGLFGPFLLIDGGVYESVGGHRAVKEEILEHMSLAPLLAAAGTRCACLGGRETVKTRMYPDGIADLVNGWTKAFSAGASKSPLGSLLLVVVWIFGSLLPLFALPAAMGVVPLPSAIGLFYPAFAGQWFLFLRRIGRFSTWVAVFYPIHLLFFFWVFGRSTFLRASGKRVVWKGRAIPTR
jgi:4,4'-diaponeurosporenoate glycosyltransferase